MNKKQREIIYNKFNGRCAYSGTKLKDDWQIDHIKPRFHYEIGFEQGNPDNIDNLVPVQKLINHYKRALQLEKFRNEWLGKLHLRLAKLPKNPRTEKSKKRKKYLLQIAEYFNISVDKPFNKTFYFETLKKQKNEKN